MLKKILSILLFISVMINAKDTLLYSLDFSKQKDGSAIEVLKAKGFEFLLDSKKLNMNFLNGKLEIETKKELAGLFGVRLKKPLNNVSFVTIEWGVEKFPKGSNWATGNNRLAIGAIFVLGNKKFSSGVPFVKSVPYFLAPFIGEKETKGKKYLGKLYKEAGRYYCVSNKKSTTITKFNIENRFKTEFGLKAPPLTAFAFQMNTKDTQGSAKAYIKSIKFYSK